MELRQDNRSRQAPGRTEDYKRAGGGTPTDTAISVPTGFPLTYDTRDVPANPYKELIRTVEFHDIRNAGGDDNFSRSESDYRQYNQLVSEKCWHGRYRPKMFSEEHTLNKYVLSGTPSTCAVTMGQYRDKSSHTAL